MILCGSAAALSPPVSGCRRGSSRGYVCLPRFVPPPRRQPAHSGLPRWEAPWVNR